MQQVGFPSSTSHPPSSSPVLPLFLLLPRTPPTFPPCSFAQRRPEIHLFAARFKEQQGRVEEARSAFEAAGKDLLEAVVRRANFERRQVRGRKVEGTARHHPAATIGVPVTL